jgi:hypothetical protein
MEIKNGKIKLNKSDKRYGNFVITTEDNHYKIQSISKDWGLRVSKGSNIGKLINECISDTYRDALSRIISFLYIVSSTIVDVQTMQLIQMSYYSYHLRLKIKTGNPVCVYGSSKELIDDVLKNLSAFNIWLDKEEIIKLQEFFENNYKNHSEVYNPSIMNDNSDLEEQKIIHEELDKLKKE